MKEVQDKDVCCEKCKDTKLPTRYDSYVSPLRLCVKCFYKLLKKIERKKRA